MSDGLPIGTSAGQHLVDANDVKRVDSNTKVESLFSSRLHDVLVGADTGSFQCFRRKLLILVGYEMTAEGEVVHGCTLSAQVKNADLGVWHTTVIPRLGETILRSEWRTVGGRVAHKYNVRLVLAVTVAASGTATHLR